MLKIRLFCAVLLGLFVVSYAEQSVICNQPLGYDVRVLTQARQWNIHSDYGCLNNYAANCDFYISFCQTAPACFNEYSACQNASGASNVTVIGAYSSSVFFDYEDATAGFYAKFSAGPSQNVSNTTICSPSLLINFQCDPTARWLSVIGDATATAPEPEDISFGSTEHCQTVITYKYDGACLKKDDPVKNGLGGGAIFLIILFSTTGVYLIVGMLYNGLVNHKSGLALLPNVEFWLAVPLYVIAGMRCLTGGRSSSSKATTTSSSSNYEAV